MSGVIVVAPRDASWAARAEALLVGARLHVAWLHDLRITGLLVLSGGVRAILVDRQCTGTAWPAQVAKLTSLSPRTRLIVIDDRTPWPDDPEEALALVG